MKKLVSSLAIVLTLFTSALPTYSIASSVIGDANGDSNVDIADVIYLRMYLMGSIYDTNEDHLGNLDFTQNGIISYADVDALNQYILS